MMESKKQRYYTFMVVPHDAAGRAHSFRVPALMLHFFLGALVFSVILVGSSLVYSTLLSRRLVYYHKTMAKNNEQKKIIESFTFETDKVNTEIAQLAREQNQLRRLLGLRDWKSKIQLTRQGKAGAISQEIKNAGLELAERKKSLAELKKWVDQARERYASTPSCWPLRGQVMSHFGYRIFPWRGFHSGLDISANYGSPVVATADGVVSFTGWRRGYGKTVIIDHGYGKETLYAHCARYAVRPGERVSKGQVISYVGTTGYTTGSHLHYEVHTAGKAVNPVAYLNLNILTASRMWRR